MKKTLTLFICLILLNFSYLRSMNTLPENTIPPGDSLRILSTPELYKTAVRWVEEYKKLYPQAKIGVVNIPESKTMDKMVAEGNIAFVSNDHYAGFNSQTLWRMVVGRDVIVPVINSKNPFSDKISRQGVTQAAMEKLSDKDSSPAWGILINSEVKTPVTYYWINDESVITGIRDFIKTGKIVHGTEVKTGEELVSAIKKDPNGLGFCRLIDILDPQHQNFVEGIKLLPIDRNGNGLLDYNENIYEDFNTFSRGLWIGKYPRTLFSNIFSIASRQPREESEIAFLKWVVTDGQQFLYTDGYSDLVASERQMTVEKLNNTEVYLPSTAETRSLPKTILIIIGVIIAAGVVVDSAVRHVKRRIAVREEQKLGIKPVLDENSIILPNGIYYDKTHTWAFMDQSGVVKVGIDDFLQHVTGPITRIKMNSPGKAVAKGEQILSIIQNGKQLNLYSPISGTIIEENKNLETDPSVLNTSPYADGWIYKIEPTNWHRENQLLFMAQRQKEYIKNEFSRLKDFLVLALREDKVLHAMVVLQDGGELRDGVLTDKAPEVWEEFQTKFIDTARVLWFYEIF